jgi:hypothetical protein
LDVGGVALANVTLAVRNTPFRITRTLVPGYELTEGLVAFSGRVDVGLQPIQFGGATGGILSGGSYQFNVSFHNITSTQLATSYNASNPRAIPGDCFGGVVNLSRGQGSAYYAVSTQVPETVAVSFVSIPPQANLSIIGPDGSTLANIPSGAFATVALPPGTSIVQVSSPSTQASAFLVGWGDPPQPEPCRPACLGTSP